MSELVTKSTPAEQNIILNTDPIRISIAELRLYGLRLDQINLQKFISAKRNEIEDAYGMQFKISAKIRKLKRDIYYLRLIDLCQTPCSRYKS